MEIERKIGPAASPVLDPGYVVEGSGIPVPRTVQRRISAALIEVEVDRRFRCNRLLQGKDRCSADKEEQKEEKNNG
jgi:hypothetical protein